VLEDIAPGRLWWGVLTRWVAQLIRGGWVGVLCIAYMDVAAGLAGADLERGMVGSRWIACCTC
jgi:hypothetical protein